MCKEIKKSNALINAKYTLSLNEQRIILLAIHKCQDLNKETVAIHAEEYAEEYKVSKNSAYEALKEGQSRLYRRELSFVITNENGNKERFLERWVDRVSYIDNEAICKIKFKDVVLPMIKEVQKNFSYYGLERVAGLTSSYALRLYEIIIAWRSIKKTPEINLEELREMMGLDEQYKTMSNFKKRVIEPAIEQINERTDVKGLKYQQIKHGRTITGFVFTFGFKVVKDDRVQDLLEPKRDIKRLTKSEAEKKARPGESYFELEKRLRSEGFKVPKLGG